MYQIVSGSRRSKRRFGGGSAADRIASRTGRCQEGVGRKLGKIGEDYCEVYVESNRSSCRPLIEAEGDESGNRATSNTNIEMAEDFINGLVDGEAFEVPVLILHANPVSLITRAHFGRRGEEQNLLPQRKRGY
jgi:hypothetical protein